MDLDICLSSESGRDWNYSQIQFTLTIPFGTVQWVYPKPSDLGSVQAGYPVGPSVSSINALTFAAS